MEFELKLDMHNAEQEAVWLNDFIHAHGLDDLETQVKTSEPEPGTMDGGILLAILVGATSGVVTNRFEWLFKKIREHFSGKKVTFELSATCRKNRKQFTMKFELKTEKERDEAQAEFNRRYAEICKPKKSK